jgi:hypothetical protein
MLEAVEGQSSPLAAEKAVQHEPQSATLVFVFFVFQVEQNPCGTSSDGTPRDRV